MTQGILSYLLCTVKQRNCRTSVDILPGAGHENTHQCILKEVENSQLIRVNYHILQYLRVTEYTAKIY